MDRIYIEDVRCFHALQEIPFTPLTFLVGENSAGKTTFLAAINFAHELARALQAPDFNQEPFQMGAYDQIAHTNRGTDVASSFKLGFGVKAHKDAESKTGEAIVKVLGVFSRHGAEPKLDNWTLTCGDYSVIVDVGKKTADHRVKIDTPKFSISLDTFISTSSHSVLRDIAFLTMLLGRPEFPLRERMKVLKGEVDQDALALVGRLAETVAASLPEKTHSFAPIRTTPKRTYDVLKETPNATGDHVPMVLARALAKSQGVLPVAKKNSVIKSFGKVTGLFNSLNVKRLGNKESDPFQVKIRLGGPAVNIVDVGYGVSQVLPILVDTSLTDNSNVLYLLQQPEVHLHPKAQAGIGSYLLDQVAASKQKKQFITETHSDYLVDRVRSDVRDKSIDPGLVSILYFERMKNDVKVHPLKIDKQGNILDAPASYRNFFMEEEQKILGF